ncbi:MAG: 3D domain-containing protein [Verrucomicrobiae bacterium]|nr:3D domain-containing protein [Verrucomicrobiae bacterium]MCP5533195.1 3D domain-containing protein [Akkermansiaceae bacterium]
MDGDRAESPASHPARCVRTALPASGNTRIVTTTAYSHHEADHLAYGRRSALGNTLRYGSEIRSAAADWSVYPAGTTFRVEGLPWTYVVDDYGSALVGTGVIDLYQPDMTAMKRWGRRSVRIAILQWGSYSNSARILSRRTHHAHCRAMFEAILRRIRSAAPTCVRTPRA